MKDPRCSRLMIHNLFIFLLAAHLFSGLLDKITANGIQLRVKWDVCCTRPLEIISDFWGWPFVKSFALCYDWPLWAGGDDLPKSQLNSNLAADIKPCWTPPAPFVRQPGHQATILALFVNIKLTSDFFGAVCLDVTTVSRCKNCCHSVSIFPYFICGLIGLISQIIEPPH